jgi:ABC-type amino acid transport system permease subunit
MNEDKYIKIENTSDYKIFTFISQGRHGELLKIVRFDELITRENTYNLALGTVLQNGKVDFTSTTNNGDRNKILATVAGIVHIFIENYPNKTVYLTGGDERRTLLYQRAIAYGYPELIQTFSIYGETLIDEVSDFEHFDQAKKYSGFLIEKK